MFACTPKDIANEVACRYVRRFKPMAYKADEINQRIRRRYGNRTEPLPNAGIGILSVIKDGYVVASADDRYRDRPEVSYAVGFRYEMLKKILSKKNPPSGTQLDMQVSLIELKGLIDGKARFYGKKGISPSEPGATDRASR